MAKNEGDNGENGIRLVHQIIPGFEAKHPDKVFDGYLNAFFRDGKFPEMSESELEAFQPEATKNRVKKLLRLENNTESKRYCTELRNAILRNFEGRVRDLLLEAMKFMLRVHIDDADRIDTGSPGVSHQMKVAMNVLEALMKIDSGYRHNATIFAAAMFHDIVEDHEQLLLLETDMLKALYIRTVEVQVKKITEDGSEEIVTELAPVLKESDPPTRKVIALLAYESGLKERPNQFMGRVMKLVTLDREDLFHTWDKLSPKDAKDAAQKLKAKRGQISPEEYAANEIKKHEFYDIYGLNIFTDPSIEGEAASLIKIFDFLDNATTINLIREQYEEASRPEKDSRELANTLRQKYNSFREKYELKLGQLYEALPSWPKTTPEGEITWIGGMALELQEKIGKALRDEYSRPLLT